MGLGKKERERVGGGCTSGELRRGDGREGRESGVSGGDELRPLKGRDGEVRNLHPQRPPNYTPLRRWEMGGWAR